MTDCALSDKEIDSLLGIGGDSGDSAKDSTLQEVLQTLKMIHSAVLGGRNSGSTTSGPANTGQVGVNQFSTSTAIGPKPGDVGPARGAW